MLRKTRHRLQVFREHVSKPSALFLFPELAPLTAASLAKGGKLKLQQIFIHPYEWAAVSFWSTVLVWVPKQIYINKLLFVLENHMVSTDR